ncbi:hypothetical protein ACFSJQ_23140 [Vibrio olivae]|uniref:Uncharacterized protein n=1 Tax=Vibrio olivae TaxID=1243002 RepID=A0ABV5HPZ2_9VIBR
MKLKCREKNNLMMDALARNNAGYFDEFACSPVADERIIPCAKPLIFCRFGQFLAWHVVERAA